MLYEVITQLAAYLLAAAVKVSGLPAVPEASLPEFIAMPQAALKAEACKEKVANCRGIVALFDMERNRA